MTPSIILIDPQMGENIGMCARAMLNCGLTDLRIVNPRDGWPNERAHAASSGALDKGVTATVYAAPAEAMADLHTTYATTNRLRDMVKDVYTARHAATDMRARIGRGERVGILFGPERAGLTNEDIARATHVITIPLNPDFSSLNLAQAVLVTAYEWYTSDDKTDGVVRELGDSAPAELAEVDGLINRFEAEMQSGGFFRSPDMKPTLMRNLRSFITRCAPTAQEISTMHGILTCLGRAPTTREQK